MKTLNLDCLAAGLSQDMIKEVKKKAEKAAEERAKKDRKSHNEDEAEKSKDALIKKRTETLERLVTKALGVLQEQGVYAMMLFLFSRTSDEKEVAPSIRAQLFKALEKLPSFENGAIVPRAEADMQTALKFYLENVLDDLDTLLLVRDLYEQTLIYARYGAKAEGSRASGD
jgi:uncharacterized protein YdiU (UPF0061 family)